MEFGKSATNFDILAAELACTISEMHALPPKLAGKSVAGLKKYRYSLYTGWVIIFLCFSGTLARRTDCDW